MTMLFSEPILLSKWDIAPLLFFATVLCFAQIMYMCFTHIIFPIIVYSIILPLEYFNLIPKNKYYPKLNNNLLRNEGEIDDNFVIFFIVDIIKKVKLFCKVKNN